MELINKLGIRISTDGGAIEFVFRESNREEYVASSPLTPSAGRGSRDDTALEIGRTLLTLVGSLRPDLLERFPYLHLPVPDTSHDTPEMTERRRLLAAERQKMDDEREQLERDHDTDDD